MRKFALLSCMALGLSACGDTATVGTDLITTATVPGSSYSYRVEKYRTPTNIEGVLATHAIVAKLRQVSSSTDGSTRTTYFDFPEGAVEHFRTIMPQICQEEGTRLVDAAVQERVSGTRGRVGFRCE